MPIYTIPQPALLLPAEETGSQTRRLQILECPDPIPQVLLPDVVCGTSYFCCDQQVVFATESGAPDYQNDFLSVLFKGQNISFQLYKDNVFVADLNDATYGDYYASFSEQPEYAGYVLKWAQVLQENGAGSYCIRIRSDFGGQAYDFFTRTYYLMPFDAQAADNTVRIDTYQNGNIIRSPFDFTNLLPGGWPQSVRIPGVFGRATPNLEQDRYLNTSYISRQNRPEIRMEYTLETYLMPTRTAYEMAQQEFLANETFVTDYNVEASQVYRNLPVVLSGIDTNHVNPNQVQYVLTFEDQDQNLIKENF